MAEHAGHVHVDTDSSVADLIAAYREGPGLVRNAAAGMDAAALLARPIAGKMSTLEVVCHIVDCDQFIADRMKRTIAIDKPLLLGVHATAYLERLHYQERDLELQLRLLDVTREQMAADLERLQPDAWSREAVHSETGLVTLKGLLLHAIDHVDSHLAAIAEKRAALGL